MRMDRHSSRLSSHWPGMQTLNCTPTLSETKCTFGSRRPALLCNTCVQELFMAIDFQADPLAEMDFYLNAENGIAVNGFFTDCPTTAMEYLKTSCSKENSKDGGSRNTKSRSHNTSHLVIRSVRFRGWSLGITLFTVTAGVLIGMAVLYVRNKKHRETIEFVELASGTSPKRSENYAPNTAV